VTGWRSRKSSAIWRANSPTRSWIRSADIRMSIGRPLAMARRLGGIEHKIAKRGKRLLCCPENNSAPGWLELTKPPLSGKGRINHRHSAAALFGGTMIYRASKPWLGIILCAAVASCESVERTKVGLGVAVDPITQEASPSLTASFPLFETKSPPEVSQV